mmetsp:Transcript_3279/g.8778  ORF Transcript_3279/g.8778 Transcript_3279/m.8778 type:complete len:535 (+) Transcript_3279:50-1654(+)
MLRGLASVGLSVAALPREEVLGHLGDDHAVRLARLGALVHLPLRLVRHLLRSHLLRLVLETRPLALGRPPRHRHGPALGGVRPRLVLPVRVHRVHVLVAAVARERARALATLPHRARGSRPRDGQGGVDTHGAERLLHPSCGEPLLRVARAVAAHRRGVVPHRLLPPVIGDELGASGANLPEELLLLVVQIGLQLHLRLRLLALELRLELLLLALELREALVDLRVDKVGDVLAVENLGHDVVLPVVVVEHVVLAKIRVVDTRAAVLLLHLLLGDDLELAAGLLGLVDGDGVGDDGGPGDVIPRLGLRDVQSVEHLTRASARQLLLDARGEQLIAAHPLHLHHALLRQRGHARKFLLLAQGQSGGPSSRRPHPRDERRILRLEILELALVNLVNRNHQRLVREERLDRVEEIRLLLDGVPALFAGVYDVEHDGSEMRHGGDGLHLDRVAFLEGPVQDTRGIQYLPSEVLVVGVAHVDGLGGERVRLNLDVGAGHLVHEGRLADVGVAADEDGACVWVDGREAGHVLPDLLEVRE